MKYTLCELTYELSKEFKFIHLGFKTIKKINEIDKLKSFSSIYHSILKAITVKGPPVEISTLTSLYSRRRSSQSITSNLAINNL